MLEINFLGKIFYDNSINRFCQLREIRPDDMCVIVSQAEYYSDAATTTSEYPVSIDHFNKNMTHVVNVMDFAVFDGVGWHVKEEKKK